MIRCYRGVAEGHVHYHEALRGIARPRGGQSTPALHNQGFTNSDFTSWTTDYQVAWRKAIESDTNGHGVILQKDFDAIEVVSSPDVFGELEVLVRGTVVDALVFEVP